MALVPSHNKPLPGPVLILISRHMASLDYNKLTHLPLVLHICVSRLTIIGWDNGLSPIRRQAIIYSNAGLLLIGHLGTNISEILIKIQNVSFMKMHLKISPAKRRPFFPGWDELTKSHPRGASSSNACYIARRAQHRVGQNIQWRGKYTFYTKTEQYIYIYLLPPPMAKMT